MVCFISTGNYKNKAIQRKGVETNGAMTLQPIEAPGLVCAQVQESLQQYSDNREGTFAFMYIHAVYTAAMAGRKLTWD